MSNQNKTNSCVETPDAPEWLSILEDRRQELSKGKLGHELGQGASCNECDKCPGLDLHFWRKVCRNCKCRKDQHHCSDDDYPGWAQFEILGQIRARPAYIKIKELATQPVQLEWVPPNTSADVISDYMMKLDKSRIPVVGSQAAQKRKQQLEYQLPRHDLDAAFCDNLSEAERKQMHQYVEKIRQTVGQGNVMRVGNLESAVFGRFFNRNVVGHAGGLLKPEYVKIMAALRESPVADPILAEILTAEALTSICLSEKPPLQHPQTLIAFSEPFVEVPLESYDIRVSNRSRNKLRGLNPPVVKSLIQHGRVYDKLLDFLKEHNLDVSGDPRLGPIAKFREEYQGDAAFANELNAAYLYGEPQCSTPIKVQSKETTILNSPAAVIKPLQARTCTQETPMRKFKYSNNNEPGIDTKTPAPNQFAGEVEVNENSILAAGLENLNLYPETEGTLSPYQHPKDLANDEATMVLLCQDCLQPISLGEVAVTAERAGRATAWHPQCFKCCTCRELLADLVYFFHGGHIYCGRDLAIKLKIPRCKACDELIFTKEYTAAEDATFHIKHFCCYQCDEPLAGKQYIPDEKSNMPVCLKCYEEYFAAVCERCQQNIGPQDQGVKWGEVHWHSDCFTCAGLNCGQSLIGGRFCVKERMPFCSPACVRSVIKQ